MIKPFRELVYLSTNLVGHSTDAFWDGVLDCQEEWVVIEDKLKG